MPFFQHARECELSDSTPIRADEMRAAPIHIYMDSSEPATGAEMRREGTPSRFRDSCAALAEARQLLRLHGSAGIHIVRLNTVSIVIVFFLSQSPVYQQKILY